MSTDNADVVTDDHIHLLDDLQILLEKQIKLAHRGNISGIGFLSKQADSLVRKIARTGILELAEFEIRRERLQKLYEELCLTLTAQRAETGEKLSRIRKGKRTIEAYRSSI